MRIVNNGPRHEKGKAKDLGGNNLQICFVGLDNYAFLRPELGITHMGGEAVQQSLLARQFVRSGHTVSTIVLDYEEPDSGTIDGIRILRSYKPSAGFKGLRFFHPRASGIWRAMRKADADVYYESPASVLTGITAAFCRAYNRKFVFRIASDANCVPGEQLIGLWRDRKIYEYGLRNADVRAVQTHKQATLLRQHYDLDSVVVNMVTEVVDSELGSDRPIDVLWVNNLRNVKRPDRVIDIARQLPEYKFVVIGGASRGSEGLYAAIEAESSRTSNIEFLGSRPYTFVNECLSQSKILLNTSDLEGFPNTFLQAWMRGVPIVTTFDPDNIIKSRGLGFSTDDAGDLAELLKVALGNSEVRAECASRARQFVMQEFSPDQVVMNYIELIR